jgi:hypothetical protein
VLSTSVTDADEFRKQAIEARQMAARSLKQEDKAIWLRLAEDWIKLAQRAPTKLAKNRGVKVRHN